MYVQTNTYTTYITFFLINKKSVWITIKISKIQDFDF